MKRRRKRGPSASDVAEVASGRGSSADKKELHGYSVRHPLPKPRRVCGGCRHAPSISRRAPPCEARRSGVAVDLARVVVSSGGVAATVILDVSDRWWVIHESAIGTALVRVYNHDIDPAEALAIMLEHSVIDTGTETAPEEE